MAVQWSSEHEKQDALLLLCRDLISCVNKIMDPSSIQAERAECSQVGFVLPRPNLDRLPMDPDLDLAWNQGYDLA